MRFGLRPLVHGATRTSDIDLETTAAYRAWVHEQLRLRAHLVGVLAVEPLDPDLVRIEEGLGGEGSCEG